MTLKQSRLLLPWIAISFIALMLFALYFVSVNQVLTKSESLQNFAVSFDPLAAFFTALAFFGLVVTLIRQARELDETKADLDRERNERIEALILVTRLQASGLRLISMSIEKDENSKVARRELELMVEDFENRYKSLLKGADGNQPKSRVSTSHVVIKASPITSEERRQLLQVPSVEVQQHSGNLDPLAGEGKEPI